MTADEIGRLAYVLLIAVAVAGWLASDFRHRLGVTLRNMLAWAFIFLGVIGAIGLWDDIKQDLVPKQLVLEDGGRIEIPRALDGHYYLTLEANGQPIDFVVDTGATDIVLTKTDAARAGIDIGRLDYVQRAFTANGEVRTAPVRLETLAAGMVVDRGVPAVVNAGDMDRSLLGMRYLHRFDRLEIADGRMILER